MSSSDYVGTTEAAREIGGLRPRDVSDAFYQGLLRDDLCPTIAGRRAIPRSYLDEIARILKHKRRVGNDDR